jgi:lysophospholipase L1-like esterase
LLVLGPSRRPDDYWLDRLCVKLDAQLRIATGNLGIPYSDLMAISDEQGEKMYRPDGFHLTSSGHAYVAEQLEPALGLAARAVHTVSA